MSIDVLYFLFKFWWGSCLMAVWRSMGSGEKKGWGRCALGEDIQTFFFSFFNNRSQRWAFKNPWRSFQKKKNPVRNTVGCSFIFCSHSGKFQACLETLLQLRLMRSLSRCWGTVELVGLQAVFFFSSPRGVVSRQWGSLWLCVKCIEKCGGIFFPVSINFRSPSSRVIGRRESGLTVEKNFRSEFMRNVKTCYSTKLLQMPCAWVWNVFTQIDRCSRFQDFVFSCV